MRLRPLAILSFANLLVAALLALLWPQGSEFQRLWSILHLNLLRDDSSRFLTAACQVAATGRPVYQDLFFVKGLKFIYPPASLLLCGFGPNLATVINLLALTSVAATLFIAGEIFLHLNPTPSERHRWVARALIASLGILFSPLLFAAYLGQIQAVLTLLFTLAVWAWLRGHKGSAGLALALICCIKPPLAVFFLWALLRREWRFLTCFTAASCLLQGIALWRFGLVNAQDYLHVLTYLSHHGEAIPGNQSLNGLLERWIGNGVGTVWTPTSPYPPYNHLVYAGTLAAWAMLLAFGLLWPLLRKQQDRTADFLLFGLFATIASPIAWTHHYGIFLVASIYVLAIALRHRGKIPWWFAASFLILANTWTSLDSLTATRWNPLASYDLAAGLGIIATLIWITRHPIHQNP